MVDFFKCHDLNKDGAFRSELYINSSSIVKMVENKDVNAMEITLLNNDTLVICKSELKKLGITLKD